MLNICSGFVGGFCQVGFNLDRLEQSAEVVVQMVQVLEESEIWWRFGGGSDRNRALLGNKGNSMHGRQIAQGRINAGDFASC